MNASTDGETPRPVKAAAFLFPAADPSAAGVVAFEIRGGASPELLFPEERERMARAVEGRVREFAAGRACARAGLATLGFAPAPLLSGADRAPQWPSGVCGSISHTEGYCIAVVASTQRCAGIGVDAELVGRVRADLWRTTMRPEEIEWLNGLDEPLRAPSATILFGAKEAFYKCQHSLTRAWVGFDDVCVQLGEGVDASAEQGTFEIAVVGELPAYGDLPRRLTGRFARDGEVMLAAVMMDAVISPGS